MSSHSRISTVIVTLASVSLVLAGLSYYLSASLLQTNTSKEGENILNLTGTGTVSSSPDRVSLALGVETFEPTAGRALSSNNEAVARAIRAIKDFGVKDEELRTLQVGLSPVYSADKEPKLIGFRATNTLMVLTSMLDKAGEIVDKAVQAGANRIQSLSFTFSEDKAAKLKDEALEKASLDARSKATRISSMMGAKIVKIKSISLGDGPIPIPVAKAEFAAGVPIQPGQLQLTVTINVVYIIE